jgi:coenzyme F420-dependent glucose-6-phosphate dehydrogenase
MLQIGYALSSEEHAPNQLVSYAKMAEEAGFTFALISDHYHPWIDQQGQSLLSGASLVASPTPLLGCTWALA